MILSKPIWVSSNKTYCVNILNPENTTFSEIRTNNSTIEDSSGNSFFSEPDIKKKEFQEVFIDLAKEFIEFSKNIFSTPIKETIFIKRSSHKFEKIPEINNYGKRYLITWKPTKFIIQSVYFEIYWSTSIVLLDDTINCENISSDLTNIIEPNTEIQEVLNISPEQDEYVSSRTQYKKKLREAKLKVAIAKLRAEKLAVKYFRRYGNDLNVSYDSDLSSDSDEDTFDNKSK